jgi:hypothetical protein
MVGVLPIGHRDVVEGERGEEQGDSSARRSSSSGRRSGEVRRVRSHAVVVPSHPAGDLGGGGCRSWLPSITSRQGAGRR